jgi:magnesium chelatase family protein
MDVRRMGLSARVHDRLLIVSRTVADLSGSAALAAELVAEAAQFRSLDRNYWS